MRVTALDLVSSCTFVHDSFLLRLAPLFCFFFVFRHKKMGVTGLDLVSSCTFVHDSWIYIK